MPVLISLVGEQPEPTLLPARYLQPDETILVCSDFTKPVAERLTKLLPNSQPFLMEPYDFYVALEQFQETVKGKTDLIFNLTGGTKIMALASFAVALQTRSRFVYFQSQDNQSLLSEYTIQPDTTIEKKEPYKLPSNLITAEDFLRAYLDGFNYGEFSHHPDGELTAGGLFEQAVYSTLKRDDDIEVLHSIKPHGMGDQIEIDLVIRLGNQIAVAEVKLLDSKGDSLKKGIDQLSTSASRRDLGTYTTRLLIVGRELHRLPKDEGAKLRELAKAKNVSLIEIKNGWFSQNRFTPQQAKQLRSDVRKILMS